MGIYDRLASVQGIKNDVPNQILARDLALAEDASTIREIVDHLFNADSAVQSDCIKVLYEIGYINPALIADYVDVFIKLLTRANNRLVWGAMIALSTIAGLRAREILDARERIITAIEKGSVITVDAGIKALSGAAAADATCNRVLFLYLLDQLRRCRPKSIAQYAESIFSAVTEENARQFLDILDERKGELNPPQAKRIEKLEKRLKKSLSHIP